MADSDHLYAAFPCHYCLLDVVLASLNKQNLLKQLVNTVISFLSGLYIYVHIKIYCSLKKRNITISQLAIHIFYFDVDRDLIMKHIFLYSGTVLIII